MTSYTVNMTYSDMKEPDITIEKCLGQNVEIEITDISCRGLKCKIGDRFFGIHSDKEDWMVGCHYVTVNDEDAQTIGEKSVAVRYSCRVIRVLN